MKLMALSLTLYRGFKQIDIDFESDITIIAGVNGAGKSSILDAIAACLSHVLPEITQSKNRKLPMDVTDVKIGAEILQVYSVFEYEKNDIRTSIVRGPIDSDSHIKVLTEKFDEAKAEYDSVKDDIIKLEEEESKTRKAIEKDIEELSKVKRDREIEGYLREFKNQLKEVEDLIQVRKIKFQKLESRVQEAEKELRLINELNSFNKRLKNVSIIPYASNESDREFKARMKKAKNQPIAVYYSTSRLLSKMPPRLSEVKDIEVAAAYTKAFDGAEISLNEFTNWYRVLKESENTKRSVRIFTEMDATISKFLKGVKSLELDTGKPPRFSVHKGGKTLYLDQLSDGEQGLLALVFDLTRRLTIANPESKNPIREGKAIVLIDEIELHLHPSWQREVIKKLSNVFKGCQFVFTTHSPIILGEVKARCIRYLDSKNGGIEVFRPGDAYGLDANRILEELMNTSERSDSAKRGLDKLFKLISNKKFDEAQRMIKKLRKDMGDNEPELTRASSLIAFMGGDE